MPETGVFCHRIPLPKQGLPGIKAEKAEPHHTFPFMFLSIFIVKMLLFSPIIKKYLSISMHGLM